MDYRISGNQIILTAPSPQHFAAASFNGIRFDDVSRDPGITGITLASSTAPVSLADVSFTSNSVRINFSSQIWLTGQTAVFNVIAAPEPSTWAMLGVGFAALAWAGTRARKRDAAGA